MPIKHQQPAAYTFYFMSSRYFGLIFMKKTRLWIEKFIINIISAGPYKINNLIMNPVSINWTISRIMHVILVQGASIASGLTKKTCMHFIRTYTYRLHRFCFFFLNNNIKEKLWGLYVFGFLKKGTLMSNELRFNDLIKSFA